MAVRRSFAPLGGAHKLLISSRKTIIVTSVDPKHHGVSGRCHMGVRKQARAASFQAKTSPLLLQQNK